MKINENRPEEALPIKIIATEKSQIFVQKFKEVLHEFLCKYFPFNKTVIFPLNSFSLES